MTPPKPHPAVADLARLSGLTPEDVIRRLEGNDLAYEAAAECLIGAQTMRIIANSLLEEAETARTGVVRHLRRSNASHPSYHDHESKEGASRRAHRLTCLKEVRMLLREARVASERAAWARLVDDATSSPTDAEVRDAGDDEKPTHRLEGVMRALRDANYLPRDERKLERMAAKEREALEETQAAYARVADGS